jgi:hypothetical protein
MKNKIIIILAITLFLSGFSFAQMKKVGQSGMTYLSISLSARESAMGSAGIAGIKGVQGVFYNPASIAADDGLSVAVNQVNWLADTRVIGLGAALSTTRYGSIGIDLIYVDYGDIMGTRRVDKSVDERGYTLTGNLNIQDYAIGLSYAYAVNDRFSFGGKVKMVHEDLGSVAIAVDVIDQDNEVYSMQDREWKLSHWGIDVGAHYKTGFKDLTMAVAFLNYSTDMHYWREAFQLPLVIKMGMAMNVLSMFGDDENIKLNMAIDALHPIDYEERLHVGAEFVYLNMVALRGGYQFNHDVEGFSAGFGLMFDFQGIGGSLDYAYTNAEYFENVNRFSLGFHF